MDSATNPVVLARMRRLRWTSFTPLVFSSLLSCRFFRRIARAAIAAAARAFDASGAALRHELAATLSVYSYGHCRSQQSVSSTASDDPTDAFVALGGVHRGAKIITFGMAGAARSSPRWDAPWWGCGTCRSRSYSLTSARHSIVPQRDRDTVRERHVHGRLRHHPFGCTTRLGGSGRFLS